LAGLRRRKRHALALCRIGGDVVQVRDRARRLTEGRMRGDVLDALAVDKNTPAVVERTQVFGAGAHRPISPDRIRFVARAWRACHRPKPRESREPPALAWV